MMLLREKVNLTRHWPPTYLFNIAILGQGLIVLLSGPPGTGKTLTAEAGKLGPTFPTKCRHFSHRIYAVADKARRPLQYLHVEDLGTQASSTGQRLTKVFDLALEWNSMIILDGTRR